ncbi:hypothetical protein GOP47_0009952 [Adiantum capillus-veneris]|uniref:C2H2-type domain-containing protein n=1 Tax=Adiantum capillus-veneris TaxID=13818 RepID=A0A9D4UXU2_ADICA|nr:hypothetical protein GOP47_0009952 [Adiantum capillus-veneris]
MALSSRTLDRQGSFCRRLKMSREGDKGMKMSDASSEEALSPRSGKRVREEKEVVPCVEATDLVSPVAGVNIGEDQATSEENGINAQSGKRIKCGGDSQLEKDAENTDTLRKVAASFPKDEQALTSEGEEEAPFLCRVCCVTCTSKKDYDTHIAGKRHAKAVTGVVVTPRSGKASKKAGMSSKAKVVPVIPSEDVPMKQQAMVVGSFTNAEQAGKGPLSSCTGCTDMESTDLQACRSPEKSGGKDMVAEQQDLKEDILMESLGIQVLKNGPTCKVALHDQGNENCVQPLANGYHVHNASADGFVSGSNNIDSQNNKSLLDLARCKSSSEGIARALAAAYQACACPGFESFLKSGTLDQAAGCGVSQAAGTVSSNMSAGMVSMHTHCFMNLLHDVQVKGIEGLFLHVIREERVRGLTKEPWLSNGTPMSVAPPAGEKDLNCTVCRVEYGSKSDLDRHVTGKKHTSLVARLHARCNVCNVNCNSEKDYEKHVNGKKHASKVRLVQKRAAF